MLPDAAMMLVRLVPADVTSLLLDDALVAQCSQPGTRETNV